MSLIELLSGDKGLLNIHKNGVQSHCLSVYWENVYWEKVCIQQ